MTVEVPSWIIAFMTLLLMTWALPGVVRLMDERLGKPWGQVLIIAHLVMLFSTLIIAIGSTAAGLATVFTQ